LDDTQLGTQATVVGSPEVAQAVTANRGVESSETIANKGDCHALSLPVATGHFGQPTGLRGFESPPLRQLRLYQHFTHVESSESKLDSM
jgi:hypothetical protein